MNRLFFILLILFPSIVYGQREVALKQPIVEGQTLAGIKLGDDESEIFKRLGFPDTIQSTFLSEQQASVQGLKFLLYGLDKENLLTIYTLKGKVDVIAIMWFGQGKPTYQGKTAKGIGLGDAIEEAIKRYEKCEQGGEHEKESICWHRNLGILIGGDKYIRLIQIISPGKQLPDYIKPKP